MTASDGAGPDREAGGETDGQHRICFACNRDVADHYPKKLGRCRFVLRAETPVARLRQSLRFVHDPSVMGRELLRFKDAAVRDAAEVLSLIDGGKL